MSRCFPFPPPGYVKNGATGGALIESIKLQRQRDEAKTERRKEKKREKREKRKEKKRKEDKSSVTSGEEAKWHLQVGYQKGDKTGADLKGAEDELLEKSGLTEEQEPPISSQNHCYLSDGIQTSNKRKRQASPTEGHSHGNIIRIRLPLQKHQEVDKSQHTNQRSTVSSKADSINGQRWDFSRAHGQEKLTSVEKSNLFSCDLATRLNSQEKLSSVVKSNVVSSSSTAARRSSQEKLSSAVIPDAVYSGTDSRLCSQDKVLLKSNVSTRPCSQEKLLRSNVPTRPKCQEKLLEANSQEKLSKSNSGEKSSKLTVASKPCSQEKLLKSHVAPRPCSSQDKSLKSHVAPRPCSQEKLTSVRKPDAVSCDLATRPVTELPSTSRGEMYDQDVKASSVSGRKRAESLWYKTVVEDWVLPSLEVEQNYDEDQEWLFETKLQDQQRTKRQRSSEAVTCSACSTLWPHAHYIPGGEIYALPYTVPF